MGGCGCQKPLLGGLGEVTEKAEKFYAKTPAVVKSVWGEAPTWAQITLVLMGGLLAIRIVKAFK
jgi:hypothetical protein